MMDFFQYLETVALNYGEIKWNPERISITEPFINKYNWNNIRYPSKIDAGKRLRKIIQQLLLMFCILMKWRYVQLIYFKI